MRVVTDGVVAGGKATDRPPSARSAARGRSRT